MKRTIILFALVLCFLVGCSGQTVEDEPVKDTEPTVTIQPEPSQKPDEQIEQVDPIGSEIVKIEYAPDDYYDHPENYVIYHFEDEEYGYDAIIVPAAEVYDFRFFQIDTLAYYVDGNIDILATLFTADRLSPDKPFGTRIYYLGPGSNYYAVSFRDENGTQYGYVIVETGEDLHFELDPM